MLRVDEARATPSVTMSSSKSEMFAVDQTTSLYKEGKFMSVFTNILKVLGIGKKDEAKSTSDSSSKAPSTAPPTYKRRAGTSASRRNLDPAKSAEMPMVDVVGKLESLASANPEKLDWKVSIVDLLKLLGIDSSFDARKELAQELDIPADLMDDSAKMNVWLHKTVLEEIAENGGNIPKELLD